MAQAWQWLRLGNGSGLAMAQAWNLRELEIKFI